MSNIDQATFEAKELTEHQLKYLIINKKSFKIIMVRSMDTVVKQVEAAIEKQNFSCRVYTEYRAAAMAGMAIPLGIPQLAGLAAAVGVGLHNLATFNPDYEVGKNKVNDTVTVTFKK